MTSGKRSLISSIDRSVSSTDSVVCVSTVTGVLSDPVGQPDALPVVDQVHGVLAHRALHLLVAAVPDEDELSVFARVLLGLVVHLGHQWDKSRR